jgi:hypothetical protein
MSYLLYSVMILGVFAVAVATALYQRRLGKHRGIPREEFIRTFTDAGVPSEIPAAVYDCYKSRVRAKEFGLAPDDDYEAVLSEGDEDIDDDSELLMNRLGIRIPPNYNPTRLDVPTVKTVRDMVMWLDWVRQHQPT